MDTVHAHTGRPRVSRSDHPSRPRKDQAAQTVVTPPEEYKKVLSAIPIVCVDCLVVNENEEYLLVKRANPPLKSEYWVPGGRLYKNGRIFDAVHRKMREEVGIGVDVVQSLVFLNFSTPRASTPKVVCTQSALCIWASR